MIQNYKSVFVFVFFFFTLLALPDPGRAQKLEKFTGDSTKFIGELNILFQNLGGNEKKMAEKLVEDFMQKWNREEFNPSKKQIIYTICNLMLKKRLMTFPDFYNYINALTVFMNTHQPDDSFYDWSAILLKLLNSKNTRHYLSFLGTTIDLFGENLAYKSASARWKIINPVYHFVKDTVPIIDFNKTDIVCYANDDSLVIYNTKGMLYPLSNRWTGKGGRVDWRRAGMDPARIYAEIGGYQIQMKFSKFIADSVNFYHKKYFSEPLLGRYTDKVLADVTEDKASYPRFESYDKLIGIRDIFKNIDYLGGFSMEGSKVIGFGDKVRDAVLTFRKGDHEFVKVHSKVFVVRPDRINSSMASITIFHDNDSVYHPGLQMKYIDAKKELTLTRDERVTNISPWYDSWHKIEIYCEELSWKMDEPKIDFEMTKGPNMEGKAVFESGNYYSRKRYDRLQGIDEFNPLYVIQEFSLKIKSREFTLEELSYYMKKQPEQIEGILLTLATKGFLIYDADSKKVTAKEKLFDYVKASNGLMDYDVIFFNSAVSNRSNGVLNLDNFDLRIQGVPKVFLSDSQQVCIYPAHQEVILKKDRDFLFSGKIEAGLFDFFARECSFEYEKFRLNLPTIDSMSFYVRSKTKDPATQQYPLVRVKTVINDLGGDLLIDDPKNKSGLKHFGQYPIFNSKNNAMVHWQNKAIQNGVYKKDKFNYKVYPFTFKNLGRLPSDSIQFKGYLSSAGIFPDIEQPLVLRPDYSMGIEKETGEQGLPIYGGKGTFFSRIDLSNAGLRGDGKIAYLNSMSSSDNFIFFPDSMKTLAKSFIQTEQIAAVEYPSVRGDSVTEYWLPYRDSLVVKTNLKEMAMYNNQSGFGGRLSLTPRGLTGEGTVKIRDAEMDSKRFLFKQNTFDANIANFRIKSYDLSDLTISTRNYQTHFDFEQRKGEFKSNIGISKVEFPFNKYVCSMDRFDWLIDNEEISLTNERNPRINEADTMNLSRLIDFDFGGSEFISVHPDQDSLKFFALSARYNLKTNVINCEDVKIVRVADAAIFPDSGKICILKNAEMKQLNRANIIANTSTKFFSFYNANANIYSRKRYVASGNYDYHERDGKPEQLHFIKISVDSSGQTFATGSVPDSMNFRISPEFAFTGDINLRAARQDLEFAGGFRLLTDCFKSSSWVRFRSNVNPGNVQLPVSNPLQDVHSEKIALALMFSNKENRIYPAIFSKRESFSDSVMITSSGVVDYSASTGEFRVTTPERFKDPVSKDNYLSLNTSNCMIHSDGKINMGMNSGALRMESYGTLDYYIIPDSAKVNAAVALNFPFSETGLEKLSTHLSSTNLNGISIYNTPYFTALKTFVDRKEFDKLKSEMEMVGKFKKFPDELVRTLFLAEVHFRWDSVNKSWISYGPIGIGSINKTQVNKYVKGIIEFTKKKNGDDFSIYIELTANDWYFFNFRANFMQAISSNLEFNDALIEAAKSKSEMNRVGDIVKGYRYSISTERKKRDFLRKFETQEE
jgi:hypothetical protein